MTPASALGALLLLTASPLAIPTSSAAPTAASAEVRFAPPVGVPLRYRVTTRRIGRDGTLIDFALVYALQWQRTGRGYRLDSVLERIDSGAEPGVTQMLTMMLDPLVGEEISYLVPPDGSRIDMVDPGHGADMAMEVSSSGDVDLNALVMFVVDATRPFSTPAKFE